MTWADVINEARSGSGPLRHARGLLGYLLAIRLPVIRPLAAALWAERDLRQVYWPTLLKIIYGEPLLRYRCERVGRRLFVEGHIPLIDGNGVIRIGDDVRIGGRNSWVVGYKVSKEAVLTIGDRVNVGYENTFAVARSLHIGDDAMLAPRVMIFDNPSHPMSPAARARRESFDLEDAQSVVIGRNVWIGTGALIMRGVTVGDGAVVGAMSVVTSDVAPHTLVAGNPARAMRLIPD